MTNIDVTPGSGKTVATTTIGGIEYQMVSALNADAALFRVSSVVDNGSISSKSSDAGTMLVSAKQGDAGLLRISSFGPVSANQSLSALALEGTAFIGQVSAKSTDAGTLLVSAKQGDAALLRVSAITALSANQSISALNLEGTAFIGNISAKNTDSANFRVSAILAAGVSSVGAASFGVSAAQLDAGALRTSASLYPDTTGGLTVFQTLSVSASQSVKGSAGALYGYYLYNFDSKPAYVKFYNVSANSNIGTDTPLITIGIPASAAANVEYPHGLAGFTAGINITATSGRALDNTALPGASSIGAVLFYK